MQLRIGLIILPLRDLITGRQISGPGCIDRIGEDGSSGVFDEECRDIVAIHDMDLCMMVGTLLCIGCSLETDDGQR
jgi:hypothetical protein